MIIGDRLRALREQKKFSQGEIEKRTGLLRCYISRVENGHTVPAVETLEKFARALEVPVYQLFYDGEEPPKLANLPTRARSSSPMRACWPSSAACWAAPMKATGDCCFSWLRKWLEGRLTSALKQLSTMAPMNRPMEPHRWN